LAELSKLQKLL